MSIISKILFISLVILTGHSKGLPMDTKTKQYTFNEVWDKTSSNPYDKLPQKTVGYTKLYTNMEDIISKDAKRTLENKSDILEDFDKLAHPNGICFQGTWNINKPNIYSGYFKENSKALIIARASSAMSNTKSGETRALGFAGKLFPTLDKDKVNEHTTANFFLIDDLGGTDTKYYKDISLLNEPPVSLTSSVFGNILYSIKVASAFKDADKNPTIRQLYEISQLGEKSDKNIITPKWLKLELQNKDDVQIKPKIDFRDELTLKENDKLIFNIFVANEIIDEKKNWSNIGEIVLNKSVVSNGCDKKLHFHHPRFLDDLNYGIKNDK